MIHVVFLTISCSGFDKEDFSICLLNFKYPEELPHVFMSFNQIDGFHSTYLFTSTHQS